MTMTFTPEQDQYLQLMQTRAYYQGLREGVELYAVWRNGEQLVGSTGTTLKQAVAKIDAEELETLRRYSTRSTL
jgi:hypothetical protein